MGKAVVIGLARSGVGAANLLVRLGMQVTVTDMKKAEELKEYAGMLSPEVGLSLGGHDERIFSGADIVVVSPGVPLNIGVIAKAKERGAKVVGELELAYMALRTVPFYAVTGTNGKSTTTTLLHLMMKKGGRRSLMGGNIGNALSGEFIEYLPDPASRLDCAVVEVSSFQLESIEDFRPRGAAILNITPDHLDRYRTFEEYREAKARISVNQSGDDFLVLNADDPACADIGEPGLRRIYFSRKKEVDGAYLKEGAVFFRGEKIIDSGDISIKGVHNLENAMAASAVAVMSGCPPEAVSEVLKEFEGLEHRLEFVREIDGVRYINDSKGTNVGAVLKSIESFGEPIVLIAGGRDKKGDFEALRGLMGNVRAVVAIGEAKEKLKKALGDLTEFHFEGSLKDAVDRAKAVARRGDVVLLSPACASFDMFKDFEDRGRQFKRLVMQL